MFKSFQPNRKEVKKHMLRLLKYSALFLTVITITLIFFSFIVMSAGELCSESLTCQSYCPGLDIECSVPSCNTPEHWHCESHSEPDCELSYVECWCGRPFLLENYDCEYGYAQ